MYVVQVSNILRAVVFFFFLKILEGKKYLYIHIYVYVNKKKKKKLFLSFAHDKLHRILIWFGGGGWEPHPLNEGRQAGGHTRKTRKAANRALCCVRIQKMINCISAARKWLKLQIVRKICIYKIKAVILQPKTQIENEYEKRK